MALTVEQQQILIEAQGELKNYLERNPKWIPYQEELNIKLEAAYRPEQILKTISSPTKKKTTKKK